MNIYDIKKTAPRFKTGDMTNLEIQMWGSDNLYPHLSLGLLSASVVGKECAERYAKFLMGFGFSDVGLASMVVNRRNQRANAVLRSAADDLANLHGFALHFNYNAAGQKTTMTPVPFENCRLGVEDDWGAVQYIAVHPDWAMTSGKKKIKAPNRSTVDYIDVYNPDPEVVLSQIERAGGIENYKGQILWVSRAGGYNYPTVKYDAASTDLSTDEGLANVRYRNVRNNFFPAGMLVTVSPTKIEGDSDNADDDEDGFDPEKFKVFQGDENTAKIASIEVSNIADAPQFVEFPTKNYDKDFTVTSQSTTEAIYSAFGQEAFYRLKSGSLGFSQDIISDTYNMYSEYTTFERDLLAETFTEAFRDFAGAPVISEAVINPLRYNPT